MDRISNCILELSDSILSLIILKPKSKSIIIKILKIKGFVKEDIRLTLDELIKNNYITISEKSFIEITVKGLKRFEEGGFVYLGKVKDQKTMNEKYEVIVNQCEKDKLYKLQESTIKTNISTQSHHNFQKLFLALNILFAIINLLLILNN